MQLAMQAKGNSQNELVDTEVWQISLELIQADTSDDIPFSHQTADAYVGLTKSTGCMALLMLIQYDCGS